MKYGKHEVSVRDEATGKTKPIAEIEVITEATLDELVASVGADKIVANFLRQDTQDRANAARVDWKNGGARLAREAKIAAWTEELKAGTLSPEEYAKNMRAVFGK